MKEISIKRHVLTDVDSTSTYLHQLNGGDPQYSYELATAQFQSAGRGQRGNTWESEPDKNLLFSILAHPDYIEIKNQFLVSEAISLSVIESVTTIAGEQYAADFAVKWPNDIYWKEKKLAGILIENDILGYHLLNSIIGVGLNVNQSIFVSNAPNPVSLKNITGRDSDRDELQNMILTRFVGLMEEIRNGRQTDIHAEYHKKLFRREGFHLYRDKDGQFSARIDHVRADGRLVLTDAESKTRTYEFKEVSIILQ